MTLDAGAPQPAPLSALNSDQLGVAQLAIFTLAAFDATRVADAVAAYDAPTPAVLIDAAKLFRARLQQSEQRIAQLYITLASMGL